MGEKDLLHRALTSLARPLCLCWRTLRDRCRTCGARLVVWNAHKVYCRGCGTRL